ncbi:hypothetical protein IKE82_00840 [Candidatus Saccharibacteria bacterium]|nr:hypothetical protein [Candidatus Saccharibacteria bacterium]
MPQDNTQTQSIQPTQDAEGMVQPMEVAQPMNNVQSETNAGAVPGAVPETVSNVVVTPGAEPVEVESAVKSADSNVQVEIATKIGEAKNVLIALSSDPSVDELAAAIGLSLYLDRIGRRATAIYSGATPNTLEFLKPEETFEPSADTLQDFVIAINKDKADHLRYKLDGDYVKVYITPYKHRLSEEDLEFSYGDYNVDLVIALDVANGIDLDSALREHGRIMHDASIINVTTGNPGKFGEIEWSDKSASSISEMIANLLYQYGGDNPITKDEATAFLTGVVAATNRFSNAKTTSETMRLSSQLMESGANQVLVSRNITPDTENEIFNVNEPMQSAVKGKRTDIVVADGTKTEGVDETDTTKLDVKHNHEKITKEGATRIDEEAEITDVAEADDVTEAEEKVKAAEGINIEVAKKERTLLDDLKAAEESLAHAGAETTPVDDGKMMKIENGQMADDGMSAVKPAATATVEPTVTAMATTAAMVEPVLPEPLAPEVPAQVASETSEPMSTEMPVPVDTGILSSAEQSRTEAEIQEKPEIVIAPSEGFDANMVSDDTNKYGQMVQDALGADSTSTEPSTAIMSNPTPEENLATANTPAVPTAPEINGVPEINYMPMPDAEILPPPPAPPVEGLPMSEPPVGGAVVGEPLVNEQPEPVAPVASTTEQVPVTSVAPTASDEFVVPATQPAPANEQPAMSGNDVSAFRIPGMQ